MANPVLQWAIADLLELLESFHLSSRFSEACVSAFGKEISSEVYHAALADLPPVSVVSDTTLPSAYGAYASNPPRILLAESLLTGPPGLLKDVLLEEIGHYLDDRFNPSDSPGDEGAIWAALVQGRSLTAEQLKVLKEEDDHGLVILAGQQVPVELAAVAPLPNLVVEDFFNLPSRLIPGDTVSVSWRALNTGDAATPASPFEDPAWVDSIYFSTDTDLDPSDVLLGSKPFFGSPAYSGNPLPGIDDPNNFYYNYTSPWDYFRIPIDLSGSGYILLKLDSGNSITESNEDDNVLASAAISIGPADINLTPTNLELTTQNLVWGRGYSFTYTLANLGLDDTTTEWVDSLYFSTDTTFDESDRALIFWTFGRPEGQPLLASGVSNTFWIGSGLPENEPTQQGYFFLKTNLDAHQIETNYTDNISAPIPVHIEAADVNLRVSNTANYQQLVLDGSQPVTLSFNTLNTGTETTPYWVRPYDAVFWSTDDKFDNGFDYWLADRSDDATGNYPLAPGASYDTTLTFDLPSWLVGSTGYLLLVSDPYGWLVETNELDNAVAIPTGIYDLNDLPDLSVSFDGEPPAEALLSSQPLQLSWTVTNNAGTAAAAFWYDQLWFSPDAIFDDADPNDDNNDIPGPSFRIDASTVDFWPLSYGGFYTFSPQELAVPNNISGSGFLYIKTDATGLLPEAIEGNNVSDGIPVDVEQPDVNLEPDPYYFSIYSGSQGGGLGGDPVVLSVSPTPLQFYTSSTISFNWLVSNTGSHATTAQTWRDRVLFSRDANVSGDDIVLVDRSSGYSFDTPLQGNYPDDPDSYYFVFGDGSYEYTIPDDLLGSGYLLLQVDAFDNQYEIDETDNIVSQAVEFLAPPQLNLTATGLDVRLPSNPNEVYTGPVSWGQTIILSWSVAITGDLPTSSFYYDNIVFSSDEIFGNEDDILLIENPDYTYHDPNSSYTVSRQITLPNYGQSASSGYLLFKTDAYNYQAETDENDNVYAQQIEIATPNLIITNVSAPTTAISGETVTLSWTAKNDGSVTTGSPYWYDRVVFSKNQTFGDSDDVYLSEAYIYSNYGLPLEPQETYTASFNVTLPTQLIGAGYILVKADIYNFQGESNENDNVYIQAIDIAAPNLIITNVTAPTTAISGETVTLSWTGKNDGSVTTGSPYWYDRLVFSKNQIFGDSDDVYLNETYISSVYGLPLEPQETYTASLNVSLPTQAIGAGYILVKADAYNYQGESNENDNVYIQAIDIAAPNLIITNVTAPTTAISGETVTLSWTGKNDGSVTTGSPYWYDRLVFSKNQIFGDSDDVYLNETYISSVYGLPLEPQETYTASLNVSLPAQAIGAGYLLFKTDNYNMQGETNENDNVYSKAINIEAPNLTIISATAPGTGILGGSISVSWSVLNSGAVPANADWYDSVYLSNDQTWDSGDRWIAAFWEAARSPLAANTSYTDTQNITIPSNAEIGDKYLIFVTDQYSSFSPPNQQAETNENDNAYAVAITLGAPDLIISGATASSSGVVNGSINVSWTVKNQGTTDAPADWYDVIYLSTDNIFGNGNDSYITEQYISTQTPLAANGSYTINREVNLPNVTPGNYYIYVHTDSYNYQGETNNNNNYSQAFAITIGAPDLIVSNVTAPEAAALGEAVSLSWTVQNQGTVEAPADWTDYIYWSSNDTYDGSDTFITSISAAAQTPVAAGASYSKTQNITLPNQVNSVGNGYLIVRADGNNAQGETNENNNNRAIPIRIDAPDLIVSNATAPASVTVGATIGVTWDVKNQGAVAANADWYDRVVISTDQVFGNSDDTYLTEVWQGSFTPLAAAATYSRTLNVTLPSTATGDRYLLFKADNYNHQGETDENNNVYSVPINISASDLQITATSAPSTAILGETVELTWRVTNNGTGAASQDWFDRVFLSNNQTLDGGDVQVTSELIGSQTPLAAGASYTISKNVTLPSFAPGNQYLLFVADRDNYQGEISENNNLAAVAISLTAPDLIVSNASVPATGTVGKSIEVSWTVQNQGTSAAPTDWYDRIYLSNDAVFDANADTYITQDLISTQTPLAAGASYSTTRNINLPNFATGNRYLIFVADGSGSQGETNESNNIRAAAINLNAPDLIVRDITAPVESLSGQPIEINWTVKNQGAATAEGTWYDYVSLVNTSTNLTQYVGVFEYSGSLAAGASLNRTQSYSVPLSLTGNYRVVVTTDYYGHISEGTQNESNNTTTDDRSISLQLAPVPNLQVTGVTAPSTAFSSQETVVQWTVKNVGTGATNAPVWYDLVYFSLDATYDNTDTYLGQVVNPSYLNPDDSYSNSLTVTLPRGIDGNYYFLVQADAYNYVAEVGNEGDNWGSGGPTDVNLTPPPDLQVTTVNAPNGAFSGQPMNLSWTVTNAGTGRTLETAWYDRVFMSADTTLDAGDRLLGDFYHNGALDAGANYSDSATVNLPIGVAGNFFFFVQSDVYNQVYEHVFENNNSGYDTTATNITLTPPPDLEFEYLTIPTNARSGNNLSISYRVTNFGATETPTYYWTDTFYLSSDNQLNTTTDINLGSTGQYGILYPGDGYDRTANFSLPNTLTGTYYVFGVTDSGDQVFELNNVNNVTQSINQVQIVAQPADLVVTDAVIPTTGEAGKAISVQWTVKNQGTGDTIVNSWSDRLVASTDGVLGDADDLTLASFTRTGLLAPNGTYSRTESVILPFTLEGNYQLFVVTDSANSVYEGSNEGNNGSSAFPLTISRDTPDLQVTSITLPNTVTPGQPLSLNWTVANLGVGRTNSNYWYDQVYLSLDKNVSSNDISLGSVYRAGALEPSASYAATGTFSLPVNLNGNYYVLVQADRDNNVIEGAFENNNVFASDSSSGGGSGTGTIPITPAPSADLAVSAVDAPGQGIAGQSLSLTWTVVNNDANTAQSWYDAVYLSRDQVFDRNSDIYLGYRTHTGGLTAGDSYTATQSFNIPRGLAGRFYAFVVTDSGNAIYERLGENNNVNYDGFSTEVILPPPVDLVVGTITIPVNGAPGQNSTISYTVSNQSTNEAIGTWEDTIYLSSDKQWDVNDAFFGRVSQTGPVAGGGSYSKTVTAALPGVATGDYNVIVRSDIRNYIPESNEANNIKASLDDFAVDVESLELGTPDTGTLGQGQSVYYRVDVPAGETLLLNFDSQSTAAANEIYIRYGDMPSRGQFDIGYSQPFSPDQEIIIPSTRGGTYYVLVYGDNVTSGAPSYSIVADTLEFSITDLRTNLGSNKGQSTIRISGAKFTPNDVASLIGEDGTQRQASKIWWKNSTELWATFDLQGLSTGAYDVKVNNATQAAILDGAFTVTAGELGRLESQFNLPSALRPGQAGVVTVTYANAGETDIVSPLLVLSAINANLQLLDGSLSDNYQFLAVGSEGPAGILAPGERGTLSLVFQPTVSTGEVNLNLRSLSAGDQPLDWSEIKDNSRPGFISDEAWEGIWNNFTASVGTTPQEYVAALADNANSFSQLGNSISNASQLIAAEIQQASSALLGNTLSSRIDAGSPTPGLELSFARFFQSSFDGRLKLGALGYGWTHLWDITATDDTEGTVTIQESGNIRLFERQADGSYIGQPGDNATLALVGNSYQLRESDGTTLAFRVNGNLDYLEDPNKNRITLGYTLERLTSINHSNGDRLTLDYNGQGRISQLTDATGQVTTYTYNEVGEHLLSVSDLQGTISYTYNSSSDVAQQNALQSITETDGTVTGFNYDDRGRLAQTTLNGIPRISYSYDSNTGITITNAEGKISNLLLNYLGQIGHSENPLGERIQYQYDRQGNLIQITAPNGSLSNFAYDSRNNLIKSVDALGQTVEFIYESQFDNLTTIQDQRGNLLIYDYDIRGNLTAITYSDGSQETFTLDSQGNTIVSVNRRNQTIQYTYNNQGLLIRKDFADGSSANYAYDSRGNLLSATDSDSSITFAYDTNDQLTRVTDGDGRLLKYSYDMAGRRSQMVDHNGFTTNYSYDNNGQLSRLSDVNDATIVSYSYDTVGRLIREDNGNETYSTYDYDDAGQIVRVLNYSGGGTINSSFEYAYDTLGRRISTTTLDGTTTYGYDGIGQLTSVTLPNGRTIEYTYDRAGNRISVQDSESLTDYRTNNLNQYTSIGNSTFAYDADGNLISKIENGIPSSFAYDVENRLIAVATPNGTWGYEYNALGNRIASILDGERTEYLLDPAGVVDVVGEYDNSGNLLANYVYGLGLVGRSDHTNTAYYYDSDIIGSIVGLTGATGSYLNRYEYLPFGEDLAKVETISNPFEYVGQWGVMDEGNGLDFMRERFYNPNQGRFLSTDPLGFNGGLNLYQYVFNDPLTNIDIDGLGRTKIFKVLTKIGNKLFDTGKTLTKKQAQQAMERAGKNGTSRDLFLEASRTKDAKQLARDAGGGKKPIHHDAHPSAGPDGRPHYHANDHTGGHVLYSFAGPLTLPYWANQIDPDNEWLQTGAEILDIFNPLSLPQDLLDIWDWLNDQFVPIIRPSDPNDIVGPAGFGDEKWIASQTLPYTIRFENQASATAPAQTVTVTHPLDSDLDLRTFRLGSFGWSGLTFNVPENRSFYNQRVDLTEQLGFLVDVFAGIDIQKGEAFWTLTTIDPETGETPENPLIGFLPPNNEDGVGDGFVTYSIRPGRTAETGDVIDAVATIIFDTEEPISTPPIFNTLDVDKPSSEVIDLPATTATPEFLVSWSGADVGAALASYTVYVSDNGGPYLPWLQDTTLTESNYAGSPGHLYRFISVAKDNAGNIQVLPQEAQATTFIQGEVNQPPSAVDLTNVTATLSENTSTTSRIKVADIAISDDALGTNTIALSGADAAAFEVEGTVLYLKAGTSLDYETKAAYAVTVSVSDAALSGSSPVSTGYSLSITDVNEAPTAVSLTNVTPSLSENTSTTSRIKVADIAISDDALGTNTIALSGADAAAFEVEGTVLYLKAGTSLDYETKAAYAVTVSVSDAALSGSSPVSTGYSLSITDVNEAPTAVSLTNVTPSLSENTSTTSRIKVADIAISDDALGTNTIALSGADAAAFEVEGTVLYLKAGTSLDYETKAAYAVTVSVSDAALSGSSPVSTGYSLSITDVNEAPTAVSLTNVTPSLSENTSTTSRIKVADIAISDDALGTNTIALSGADAAAFEVEGTVLYLKAGTSLDYETKAAYAVTVSVSDAALSGSSPVSTGYSLSITDVNEAPTAVALTNVTPSLSENTSTASRIKVADIAISDDALGSNTIALSGADAAAFEMDGSALFLKAGTSLNFETKTSYDVIVSVSDATISGSSPISTSYNLAVTDVNEAPTAVELSATTFDENIPDGSLVASLSSSDPDTSPQIFSYGLVAGAGDTDNLAFFITGNELHLTHTPDFESQSSYSIRLKTTDQGGLSFERDVQLVVNDLPDSPSCSISNVRVSEASPFVVVAVNLSAATTAPISFTPTLAGGGSGAGFATIGSDSGAAIQWFDAATSSWSSAAAGVTIAAGSTTLLLRTSITNDSIYEGIETFEFRTGAISGPVSNASGASGTVAIADDGSSTNSFDAGTNSATPASGTADNDLPSIGASAITVSEASPYAVVAFSLSTLSSLPVTFTPSLVSGTASIGTDTGSTIEWLNGATWESAVTGVTIPTGSSSVLVRTSLTNDNIYEGPETFQIGTGAVGGVSNTAGVSATVTIVDNGSSANTFTATSTSPFPTAGSADNDSLPIGTFAVAAISNGSETGPTPSVFRISRTGDASAALTFNYGLSGTAIRGSDFTLPASFNAATGLGTLSFDPGVSSIDLSIASLDDASVDGDRSINLGLTAPERYTLATASASVTIADNDVPLPTSPVITVVSTSAGESDAGGTRVVPVTLSLSSSSSSSITVGYRTSTSGSTATAGSDYNAIGDSTLTFAPGTSSRTFNLTINGDNTVESNESITLEFFNPVGATFAGASSTANSSFTILDNDSSSNLSRDASAASAPVALYGNPFNDTLIGGGGNDIISGDLTGATTGGADRITGNVGSDTLTGGRGADHFLYPLFSDSTLNSLDTIVDFRATTDGDRIGLAALPSSLWSSGLITPSSPNLAAAVNQVFADKDAGSAGNQPLAAGEAVFFAFDAIPGNTLSRQWYSAVNDSNTSFSASDDLLIRLAGSQTFATGNLVVTTFFATI